MTQLDIMIAKKLILNFLSEIKYILYSYATVPKYKTSTLINKRLKELHLA